MAKKKTISTDVFDFVALDKMLSSIDGLEDGSILTDNTFATIDHFIPTGNYIFNAQLSGSIYGGYANTRSYGFAGDPGAGKSFLCYNAVKQAQEIGYTVVYVDTEGAADKNTFLNFGINTDKVRYQPCKTVGQFKKLCMELIDYVKKFKNLPIDERPRVMLILDSVSMLTTQKELDDAVTGGKEETMDMGLKAKQLRSLFRAITLDLSGAKIPMLMTHHLQTGGGPYSGKTTSGGKGPTFSCSAELYLSKSQLKEDGVTKTGVIITSRPNKTRFCVPQEVEFHIPYNGVMNKYVGLEKWIKWDVCGIDRGKVYDQKEYNKMKEADQAKCLEFVDQDGEVGFFEYQKTSQRFIVKHLGKSIFPRELFTKEVFTKEVLDALDEKAIKPNFKLPELSDSDTDLEVFVEDHEEEYEDTLENM